MVRQTPPFSEGLHRDHHSHSNSKLKHTSEILPHTRMTLTSALTTATVALIASVLNSRFGWYVDPKSLPTVVTEQRTACSGREESGLKGGSGENAAESDGN